MLVSLGLLAGCGGTGTTPPAPQAAAPGQIQSGAAAPQSVALRPLEPRQLTGRTTRLVFQSAQMQTFTTQLTPTVRQLTAQQMRHVESLGFSFNITTAVNSNNLGITTGPDGRLWFCENNNGTTGKIGALSTSGVLSEYTLPSKVYNNATYYFHPISITSNAGKLWFSSGGAIGSLTTSGVFQPYLYQTSGTQIQFEDFSTIVTGSDGNLWTLDYGNPNKIWRITTSGSFAYASLTSNALQYTSPGLVSGSDGNLWFTEYNNNAIGEVTISAGTVAEYGTGLSSSNPIGITSGPDGNLWFTQKATSGTSGYLMYVTTSLMENGYTISNAPGVIASANGSVWYLSSGPTLTQFTPGGTTLYTYSLPTGSATGSWMTTGPDSNLYFTGGPNGGNVVTKFSTH